MSYTNYTNYSSYWLDEDFGSSYDSSWDDILDRKPKGKDLMELVGYRNAIANFVRIVTGRNIPVEFTTSGDSYTDGDTVTISSKLDDKEFDSAVGLALHEGSHILLTDFKFFRNMLTAIETGTASHISFFEAAPALEPIMDKLDGSFNNNLSRVFPILKNVWNYVEDRRIDFHIYKNAPGYRGYYDSLYEKYFHSKSIDKGLQSDEYKEVNLENYLFHLINLTNKNRDFNALPDLKKIWKILDLKKIGRLTSSQDTFKVAAEILAVILENVKLESDKKQKKGKGGEGGCNNKEQKGCESQNQENKKSAGTPKNGKGKRSGGKGPLSDRQKKIIEKAFQKQKDFLDGIIKKKNVTKAEKAQLENLKEADVDQKKVKLPESRWGRGGRRSDGTTNVTVINKVTLGAIQNNVWDHFRDDYDTWGAEELKKSIDEGVRLGKMLGNKLKLRDEKRDTKFTRLRTGKIDRRLVASLGFEAESVFEKIETFQYDPAIIYISIDGSSSMNGGLFDRAMKTAVAIAKAADSIEQLDVVINLRHCHGYARNGNIFVSKIYDSRRDAFRTFLEIAKHCKACGTTPEGLCYDAIMSQIIKDASSKHMYFINFSDGMPGCEGYGGQSAVQHTRKQIKKMISYNIKVLSYFIGNGAYGNDKFRQMYGKDSEFINVQQLSKLARTLNKKFLEKT